jgi:hypothetical protein
VELVIVRVRGERRVLRRPPQAIADALQALQAGPSRAMQ